VIAYLIAALGEWRERHMRKTLCLAALLLALTALAGPLSPLPLALATTLVFVASAWVEGLSPRREPKPRSDPRSFPAGAKGIAAGQAISALVLWLGIGFALSPVLAASAIAWGLSAATVLALLLCWLSAHLLAAAIHFLSKVSFDRTEGVLGFSVYVLALGWSFMSEPARIANPFVQAAGALKLERAREANAAALAEIGAAAFLFACSALVLRAKKRGARG
jgi:hypothetical protein